MPPVARKKINAVKQDIIMKKASKKAEKAAKKASKKKAQ